MSAADRDRIEPVPRGVTFSIDDQCTRSVNPAGDSIDTRAVFVREPLDGPEHEPVLRRVALAAAVWLAVYMVGERALRRLVDRVTAPLWDRASR